LISSINLEAVMSDLGGRSSSIARSDSASDIISWSGNCNGSPPNRTPKTVLTFYGVITIFLFSDMSMVIDFGFVRSISQQVRLGCSKSLRVIFASSPRQSAAKACRFVGDNARHASCANFGLQCVKTDCFVTSGCNTNMV
jgi:hypothetical protein